MKCIFGKYHIKKLILFIAFTSILISKNALALMATVNNGIACSSKDSLSRASSYLDSGDYSGLVSSGCVNINGVVYVKDYGFFSSAIEYMGKTYYIPNEYLSLHR